MYLNSIKKFISTNHDARKYFLVDSNYDIFFNLIERYSEENLEKHGNPNLTIEQFESIRHYLINKNQTFQYFSINDVEKFSLN